MLVIYTDFRSVFVVELIYQGKTKDVFKDQNGDTVLYFKDDMTGKDGVFDPGENQVGLQVEGSGMAGLELTSYFFGKINESGIPTHFLSADIENRLMKVRKVAVYGKGLEVVCRFKAVGSFYRRYGAYVEEGADLPALVEVTLKDDDRQDPVISESTLEALGILSAESYKEITDLTVKISEIIKEELAKKDLDLYDIKLEFGYDEETGEILLIDEISGGNMRVYRDGAYIEPLKLNAYLFNE